MQGLLKIYLEGLFKRTNSTPDDEKSWLRRKTVPFELNLWNNKRLVISLSRPSLYSPTCFLDYLTGLTDFSLVHAVLLYYNITIDYFNGKLINNCAKDFNWNLPWPISDILKLSFFNWIVTDCFRPPPKLKHTNVNHK